MDQKIGIAPDRRSEMRVLLERQPEVADIGLLIDGLRKRADHETLEQRPVWARGDPLDQLTKLARRRTLGERRADLERVHHLHELGDPLLLRLTVHTI
jgi:hypothetical protein